MSCAEGGSGEREVVEGRCAVVERHTEVPANGAVNSVGFL